MFFMLVSGAYRQDVSAAAGPVREQPTRVLSEKPFQRQTPPRPSGRPFAATREWRRTTGCDGCGGWFADEPGA